MNIFLRELRSHRGHIVIWSIVVTIFMYISMVKYTALAADASSSQQLLKAFPATLQAVFGMTGLDLTTIQGYYGICFIFISVMLAIHAGMLGADVIAKEERSKTAEFLYVKPRGRRFILSMKLLAGACIAAVLFIVTALATYGSIAMVNQGVVPTADLVPFHEALILIQLLFFSIGSCLAAVLAQPKRATMGVASLVFVCYIAYVLQGLSTHFSWLKYITPFGYFNAQDILAISGIDLSFVMILLIASVVAILMSYVRFGTRDLKI
jgi:ABC-2 type transport system permease protein